MSSFQRDFGITVRNIAMGDAVEDVDKMEVPIDMVDLLAAEIYKRFNDKIDSLVV